MSLNRGPENPDPNLDAMFNSIGAFLRTGESPELPAEPIKNIAPDNPGLVKNLMGKCIQLYLNPPAVHSFALNSISPEIVAKVFRDKFKEWQSGESNTYIKRGQKEESQAVQNITLLGMADFARDKSYETGKETVNKPDDDPTHKEARYWDLTEQIIRIATEQEKKNP